MYVIWYTAMSMDGRIASPDNSLEFLDTIEPGPASENGDTSFDDFVASVDAVIAGATTMRWLLDRGHSLPAAGKPTWIVSHDASIIDRIGATDVPVRRFEGDLAALFLDIEAQGHDRVWLCGGGDVAGQALAIDRIDEVVVTIAPTVLGSGPALFDASPLPLRRFRLTECRADGSAAKLTWQRRRDGAGATGPQALADKH